jgi:hypothetical protein
MDITDGAPDLRLVKESVTDLVEGEAKDMGSDTEDRTSKANSNCFVFYMGAN